MQAVERVCSRCGRTYKASVGSALTICYVCRAEDYVAPPGKRGDYKQAMGAVVPATDEPPEATIRRMRDDGEGSDGP